jgi:hypothetical protein
MFIICASGLSKLSLNECFDFFASLRFETLKNAEKGGKRGGGGDFRSASSSSVSVKQKSSSFSLMVMQNKLEH